MLTPAPAGFPDPVVLSTMTDSLTEASLGSTIGGASAAHPVAGNAYFFPVRLGRSRTYTKAWWLNGATAAGNVDVGIYTIAGTTATRIVASTAEAQAGISAMQVAAAFTTTTLRPGLYYIALAASLGTATFWRAQTGAASYLRPLGCFTAASAHPLPATATVTAMTATYVPVFGFAEWAI